MLTLKNMLAVLVTCLLLAPAVLTAGDPVRGQELALDCALCHGEDGMGDDDIPRIAGRDEAYIIAQLKAFKSGERISRDDLMLMYVEDID